MEEMASLWCYQETVDEVRQKLLYANLELEQLKAEKTEELRKSKEYVKQLIQLLKMVCQERDQLQKLFNNLDNPLVKSTKSNSSVTDQSNSLQSDTYNYHPHNSSPKIDSFLDAVPSPEFSNNNNNMADSNAAAYMNQLPLSQLAPKVDRASLVIDSIVKGKSLPQQGKFLQSVLESGPLLETLLVSGQLPQWQNPPRFKSFNIPLVNIKGCESDTSNQNLGANLNYPASRSLHSQPYFDMSCGSSQMVSMSMLNFANSASASCLENQILMSAGADLNSFVLGKRQRLH